MTLVEEGQVENRRVTVNGQGTDGRHKSWPKWRASSGVVVPGEADILLLHVFQAAHSAKNKHPGL